jgi:hypothetical protein
MTNDEKEELKLLKEMADPKNFGLSDEEKLELEILREMKRLEKPKAQDEKGVLEELGSDALELVTDLGETIDTYTGAPARAAVHAAQVGENPLSAFGNQFGEDPSKAPTGKEIAQKMGVSDSSLSDLFPNLYTDDDEEANEWFKFKKGGAADISASGAAGLGYDLILDPTLLASPLLKGISKGAKFLKGSNNIDKAQAIKNPTVLGNTSEAIVENTDEARNILNQVLNPKRSKNADRLLEIARGNKIDPNQLPHAVEFGKNSFPSRVQRFKAEGPLGEPILDQMENALRQIDHALENNIVKIGGQNPKGIEFGGNLIREGYDRALDKLYKNMDITYSNIHKLSPGLPLSEKGFKTLSSKLNGLEKWAKGKAKRGIPGEGLEEARHLQKVIEAIKAGNGSVKQTVEIMQDIGELAFKSQNYLEKTPKNIEKLKELYFTMSKSVIESVESGLGKDMAKALKENNRVFNEFFDDRSFLKQIGNKNISPEALFKSIVKKGDSNQIRSLKKIFDPETLQGLKSEYLNSLISRNADGHINFRKLRNALSDENSQVLKLFSGDEIKSIRELIELRDSMGSNVLSSSGTGASNAFMDFFSHPIKSIGTSSTGDALSKNYVQVARGEVAPGAIRKTVKGAIEMPKKTIEGARNIKKLATSDKVKRIAMVSPAIARTLSTQNEERRLRGREKWALDGLYKLIEKNPDSFNRRAVEKIYDSKEGKRLLVEASSVSENSKRMKNIILKLKKLSKERDNAKTTRTGN